MEKYKSIYEELRMKRENEMPICAKVISAIHNTRLIIASTMEHRNLALQYANIMIYVRNV